MRKDETKAGAHLSSVFSGAKKTVYHPEFSEFKRLSSQGNLIPVYREILADLETPLSAFKKLRSFYSRPKDLGLEGEYAYLLESVERGEHFGRYSFLGVDPFMVFKSEEKGTCLFTSTGEHETYSPHTDPVDILKKIMQRFKVVDLPSLPIFFGGAVGYVGYDVVKFWEDISSPKKRTGEDLNFPHLLFILTRNVVIFDHLDHRIKIISFAFLNDEDPEKVYTRTKQRIDHIVEKLRNKDLPSNSYSPSSAKGRQHVRSNFTPQKFAQAVRQAKRYIKEGDIFQVVLSQRFKTEIHSSPFDIYRILRSLNPSPYMYFLKCGKFSIVGSSPEILVRKEERRVILRPIAGTRPRGESGGDDARLARQLCGDDKEKAEHLMLVDLGRNDLGRVCEYGTVKVKELFSVEKYSHVMHLVSEIEGKLQDKMDQFDLLRACFPAGTVSGAPKVRAMQIIEELEPSLRGPYAGAIGYFGFSGNMDTCITIRTMVIKDNTAYIQAGAGIVADSVPDNEYTETVNKAKALVTAIRLSEEGEGWLW